jgi:serine/threonine protein phosphatase PrpC
VQIEMGAASHVGRVRSTNEDSYLTRSDVAVVADGMGGHSSGDVASRLAIGAFEALPDSPILAPQDIHGALDWANDLILQDATTNPSKAGMGTTVTGLALVGYAGSPHWMVFNVGDSRVYRVDTEHIVQLTVDHSEVAELVTAGKITTEQARTHPLRHVVTRSLGTEPAPTADVWIFPATAGDAFVVCSDGLTDELEDTQIGILAVGARTSRDAAAVLVGAAVSAGGRDNVTAIVVRLIGEAHASDETNVSTAPRRNLMTDER